MEHWDAGGDESYVYTESWNIAKELKREFRRCAVYIRGSHAFAWQFKVPKRLLKHLQLRLARFNKCETEIAGKIAIKNQQLTGTLESEFASG